MAEMAVPGMAPPAAPVQISPAEGLKMRARLELFQVLKTLERVLPVLGAASDEGRSVLTAMRALATAIPKDALDDPPAPPAQMAPPQRPQMPPGPGGLPTGVGAPQPQMLGGGY